MNHNRMDTTDLRAKLGEGTVGQKIIATRLLPRRMRRALASKRGFPSGDYTDIPGDATIRHLGRDRLMTR